MKVGTLTYPGSPSHGASLQMYALYTVLMNMGVDVEVINYVPDTVIHNRNPQKGLKDAIASLFLKDSKVSFKRFEDKIRICPNNAIKSTEDLKIYTREHDRIIVGSDQVWNPVVTGNDMNFYLEFCEDNSKKASYAPSFGVDHVSEEDRERIAHLLSEIEYISAREERGKEIIHELTGREAPVVLDPTFLVKREEWKKIKEPSGAKGEYVFVYTIKPSSKLRNTAQKFADTYGYNLVYISGGLHGVIDKINPNKHPVFGVGPAEFLDLIDNAKCIFTNSFHGAALSIILNKNFYVEFSSDTNSRLVTLVRKFELEDRIIDCDRFNNSLLDINYDKVNSILDEQREESLSYLKGIVR